MGYFDDKNNQKAINDAVKKSLSPFEPGVYTLALTEVKKIVSKKEGKLFLKLTFADKSHKPVEHMFGWQGKYKNDELKKLGQWAYHISGGHNLVVGDVLNDEDEVAEVEKWLTQYIGRSVKMAIKSEEEIFTKEEDGEFKIIKFIRNRIYMLTSPDRSLIITDMSKLTKKLKPEDAAKWKAYRDKKEKEKAERNRTDNNASEADDIPTDDSAPADNGEDFDEF